jgi:hypothetical protein
MLEGRNSSRGKKTKTNLRQQRKQNNRENKFKTTGSQG